MPTILNNNAKDRFISYENKALDKIGEINISILMEVRGGANAKHISQPDK